jgi:hypothetical protein
MNSFEDFRSALAAPADVRPRCYLFSMEPAPVALDEQLPKPEYGCTLHCRVCRGSLLYQRQERPRFPAVVSWWFACS